jgi:hypothetical protein
MPRVFCFLLSLTCDQLRQDTAPALSLGARESNKKRTIQKIVKLKGRAT